MGSSDRPGAGVAEPKGARGLVMDYTQGSKTRCNALKSEGRYRVFADIVRSRGRFPPPTLRRGQGRPITVWCSNDYLGHGPEPGGARGDARGDRRGRRRLRRHAQHLRHHALSRRARARAGRPARQGSRAAVHLGLRRQRGHAVDAAEAAAGLHHLLGRAQPRLDDRRHPQRRRREADLAPQRSGRPRGQLRSGDRATRRS